MLDVEEADVEILEENINKSRELLAQVTTGLKKIQHSSHRLEALLKPMISSSRRLEIYQQNIRACMQIVEKVKDYASIVARYDATLRDILVLEGDLSLYIKCLKDSKILLSELHQTRIDEFKGVLDNLVSIIKMGEDNLLTYAKKNIIKFLQPFDPTPMMENNQPFPALDSRVIQNLVLIIQYFADYRKSSETLQSDDFLEIENIYIEQRRLHVTESLKKLEPATKPVSKGANVPYEKNLNGINHYTLALNRFILAENDLIIQVFSNIIYTKAKKLANVVLNAAKKIRIFEKLFYTILSHYVSIVQGIIEFINKNYSTDGVLAFELIQCYLKLQPTLDKVSATAANNKNVGQLETIFGNVRVIAGNLFKEYLRFIDTRISGIMTMPSDNGVSECTVELMSRMRKFAEYKEASMSVIGAMKPGTWIPSPKPQWLSVYLTVTPGQPIDENDKHLLLSSYFSDCIDAIIVSLEIKAKALIPKKTSVIGIFLATNLSLIDQISRKSEIVKVLGTAGADRMEKLRKRALNMFLTNWKTLAATLMDVTVIPGGTTGGKKLKIGLKDKDAIKEKFKSFNSEFDELVKVFKLYNIKDQQLRQSLIKDISFIIPLYNRFYEKYSTGDYAKLSAKYIKYDKAKLANVIHTL